MKNKIISENEVHLRKIIDKEVIKHGCYCDLNHIDVSQISNMSFLFKDSKFNGDISQWNVSNVKDMSFMFFNSLFDGDLSDWNCIKAEYLNDIFYKCLTPVPYWAKIGSFKKRIIAIEVYQLKKQLEKNVINKQLFKKNLKI